MKNKFLLAALVSIFFLATVVVSTSPDSGSLVSRTKDFFLGETGIDKNQELVPNSNGQTPAAVSEVTGEDHVIGNPDSARLILIEYADLNCVFCAQFQNTMKEVVNEYDGEVAWIYRHYPLSNSILEAQAAECIGEQGSDELFWQFIDEYYQNKIPGTMSGQDKIDALISRGNDLGVDISECMASEEMLPHVTADLQNAEEIGLNGTPSTVLIFPETGEHEVLAGAYSSEDLIEVLGTYLR